jgi:putative hydrolase of the HAD superfamily
VTVAVRAVIFDRDGVLVTIERERFARLVLSRIPLSEADLTVRWRAFLGGRALRDGDEESCVRGFLSALADELGLDEEAKGALLAIDYTACVRCFDDAREALTEARRRRLRVGLLTNNSMGLSPARMLARQGLDGLVDVALTSQMIGARKPEPAAYRAIAAALGVPAPACIFFDDARPSVDGARAAGMRAFQVDRARDGHDIDGGVVRDLSALGAILGAAMAP